MILTLSTTQTGFSHHSFSEFHTAFEWLFVVKSLTVTFATCLIALISTTDVGNKKKKKTHHHQQQTNSPMGITSIKTS